MPYSVSIEEFAAILRQQYPEMGEGLSDLELSQLYFQQYPDSKYLENLENPDLVFPTAEEPLAEEPEQQALAKSTVVTTDEADYINAKVNYEERGSEAAPWFGKQLVYRMAEHLTSMPGAIAGYAGWAAQGLGADETGKTMIDTGEDLRRWGKDFMEEMVADDMELQALQFWQEDEPVTFWEDGKFGNFYQGDMFVRGMASAMPSLIEMALTGVATRGLATVGYMAKGAKPALTWARAYRKAAWGQTAGGIIAGTALEGSETWNTAMEYAKSEGMSNEEAAQVAGVATSIAAPIKGAMEYLSFTKMARSIGLKEIGEKEMVRILTGKVIRNMAIRGLAKGLENGAVEAMTEWMQFMTDAMVQKGYKDGLGDNPVDIMNNLLATIPEEGWSAEARESIYGGFLMGKTTGLAGGSTKAFGRHTPEQVAKRLKDIDQWVLDVEQEYEGRDDAEAVKAMADMQKMINTDKVLSIAVEGMDKDQRTEFFKQVDDLYLDDKVEGDVEEAPVSTKYEDITEDDYGDYLKSLALPAEREAMVMRLRGFNLDAATDEQKETDVYKYTKAIIESNELPVKYALLKFLQEDPAAFKVMQKQDDNIRLRLLSIATKGIIDSGGLGVDFDFKKATDQQLENLVKMFITKGNLDMTSTGATLGEDTKVITGWDLDSMTDNDIKSLFYGQDKDVVEEGIETLFGSKKAQELVDDIVGVAPDEITDIDKDASVSEEDIEAAVLKRGVQTDEEAEILKRIDAHDRAAHPELFEEEETPPLPAEEIAKMLVKDLKVALEKLGQPTTGNKAELRSRLEAALISLPDSETSKVREKAEEVLTLEEIDAKLKPTQTVEELTAEMRKSPKYADWTDKKSEGSLAYERREYEKFKKDPIKYLEDKVATTEANLKKGIYDDPAWTKKQVAKEKALIEKLKDEQQEQVPERKVSTIKRYTPSSVSKDSEKVYIFGDNLEQDGKGGQAIIRDEDNAFGIPTKKDKGTRLSSYMTDNEYDANVKAIDDAIAKIPKDKDIMFPEAGIGTKRAKLAEKAPKTYEYLRQRIKEEFGLELPSMPPIKEEVDTQTTDAGVSEDAIEDAIADAGVPISELDKEVVVQNISSSSKDPFLAALTNRTQLAKSKGNVSKNYPVKFRGDDFLSAEKAYQKYKSKKTDIALASVEDYNLMVEVIEAKLEQHPELAKEIDKRGGQKWIESTSHTIGQPNRWTGQGTKSMFVRALRQAYINHTQKIVDKKGVPVSKKTITKPTPLLDKLPSPQKDKPTKTYAGIGISKGLPKEIKEMITKVAIRLEELGYKLNSGGASGTDTAFEAGVKNDSNKNIFYEKDATDETRDIAKEIHPASDRLGAKALNLMARNTNQVFGANLDTPVDFVLVYTPRGEESYTDRTIDTGGSGQAIEMASRKGIPVINLANEDWANRLAEIVGGEQVVETTVSDLGVTHVPRNKRNDLTVYEKVVRKLIRDTEGDTKKSGHKSVWFGARPYSYSGADHTAKTMPDEIIEIMHKVEDALGLERGYYNSVLMNEYPAGTGIPAHSDAEEILTLDETGHIGHVGVLSLGGDSTINIHEGATFDYKKPKGSIVEKFLIKDGDIYNLPAGSFQNSFLHSVGDAKAPRMSLTFRRIKEPSAPASPNASETSSGSIHEIMMEIEQEEKDAKNKPVTPSNHPTNRDKNKKPPSNTTEVVKAETGAVKVTRDPDNRKITLKGGKVIQYNDDQQSGYDKLMKWAKSKLDKSHFALMGYAGTGKSTLVADIIDELTSVEWGVSQDKIGLAAPTHAAAKLLGRMGETPAITVASLMAMKKGVDLKKAKRGKTGFSRDPDDISAYLRQLKGGYLIIDESSMIDREQLQDMLELLNQLEINAIYMGDPAQLPPVKEMSSAAFKMGERFPDLISEFESHELTMVERQAEDNPLFQIYTTLRNVIKDLTSGSFIPYKKVFNKPREGSSAWDRNVNEAGQGLYYTEEVSRWITAALSFFKGEAYTLDKFNTRIVTGTREAKRRWNNWVRGNGQEFNTGTKTVKNQPKGKGLWDNPNEQFVVGETMMPNENRRAKYHDGDLNPKDRDGVSRDAIFADETIFNSVPFEIIEIEEGDRTYEIDVPTTGTELGVPVEEIYGVTKDELDQLKTTIKGYWVKIRDGIDKNGENINEREIFIAKNTNDRVRQFDNKARKDIILASGKKISVKDWDNPIYTNDDYLDSNEEWVKMANFIRNKRLNAKTGKAILFWAGVATEFQTRHIRQFYWKIGESDYGESIMLDPDVEYGYATTVHKAQGATMVNAFVDEGSIDAWSYAQRNPKAVRDYVERTRGPAAEVTDWDQRLANTLRDRMLYTAFTRPTDKLLILNTTSDYAKRGHGTIEKPLVSSKPPSFEYQTQGKHSVYSNWKKDVVAFEKIQERLAKHFPGVKLKSYEKIVDEFGKEQLGRALGYLAEWSRSKATLDTVPHEYAHIYLNMYDGSPIVKQGVKKFGKEKLAQYIGEYYAGRMTGSLKKRVGMFLKQFWLSLKKLISPDSFTDQDVMEYLAGSFWSGKAIGQAKVVNSEGAWEYMSDETGWIDGRTALDYHSKSYFERNIKHRISNVDYGKLIEIAGRQEDFDTFKQEYLDFFRTNPLYDNADLSSINDRHLRQFWQRTGSKINIYNETTGQGKLELEVVFQPGNGEILHIMQKGMTYRLYSETEDQEGQMKALHDLKNVPLYETMTYTEQDGVNTIYLNLNDVVEEFQTRPDKQGQSRKWWQNPFNVLFQHKKSKPRGVSDVILSMTEMQAQGYVFVGSKGGDHSSLLFTKVPKRFENMTRDEFAAYWQREVDKNHVSLEHFTEMFKNLDNEYGQGNVNAYAHNVAKHEWWKSVKYPQYLKGTHIGSTAEKTMGVQDQYDRLKINFQKGFTVRGLGESSIMSIDSENAEVTIGNSPRKSLSEFDGWMLSSGTWFKKLGDALGENNLTAIKGAVRSRSGQGSDINYIGTKSMQMRPFPGMKIYEKGTDNLIAVYRRKGRTGSWESPDGTKFDHVSPTDTSKMTNGIYSELNTVQKLPEGYQKITKLPHYSSSAAFPVVQGELGMDREMLKDNTANTWATALKNYVDEIIQSYTIDMALFIGERDADGNVTGRRLFQHLNREVADNDIMTEMQRYTGLIGEDGKGFMHPSLVPMWIDSIANKFIKHGMMKLRNRTRGLGTMLYYKPYFPPAFGDRELEPNDFAVSSDNRAMTQQVERAYKDAQPDKADALDGMKGRRGYPTHLYLKELNKWLDEKVDGKYVNHVPVLLSRQPVAKLTGVVVRNIRHLKEGGHGETIFLSNYDVLKVFDGDWDGDTGMIAVITNEKILDAYQKFNKGKEFAKKKKAANLLYFGKQLQNTSLTNPDHVSMVVNNINAGMNQIGMIVNARNTMFSMNYKRMKLDFGDGTSFVTFNPQQKVLMDYVELDIDGLMENNAELFNDIQSDGDAVYFVSETTSMKGAKESEVDGIFWHEMNTPDDVAKAQEFLLKGGKGRFHLQTTKEHEFANIVQMAVDDSKFGLLGGLYKGNNNELLVGLMFAKQGIQGKDNVVSSFYNILKAQPYYDTLRMIKKSFNFSPMRQGIDDTKQDREKFDLKGFFDNSKNIQEYGTPEYPARLQGMIRDIIVERLKRKAHFLSKMPYQGKMVSELRILQDLMKEMQPRILIKPENNDGQDAIYYDWKQETPQDRIIKSLGKFYSQVINPSSKANLAEVPFYFNNHSSLAAHRKSIMLLNRNWEKKLNKDKKKAGLSEWIPSEKDLNLAVQFAEATADEYYPMVGDVDKEISLDFSDDVDAFKDKWMPVWEKLTPDQQALSTIYQLIGTSSDLGGNFARKYNKMKKFLPIDMMHEGVLKMYLTQWHDILMSDTLHEGTPKDTRGFGKAANIGYNFNAVKTKERTDLEKICG